MNTISKETVLATENSLLEAVKSSDVARLEEMLHEDLLFHLPNGQMLTRAMDLEAHRSGNVLVNTITASDYVVNIIEDTAVVSVLIETAGSLFGQAMAGKFRYIRVWKSYERGLKVIAGSCIQLG